jgi:V/A-type H+-transporting ATPase subunit C
MTALDRDYYDRLLRSVRFFQGDEGIVRRFLRNELDVRNILLLLKAKDAEVSLDLVQDRFLDGGSLTRSQLPDLYNARSVPELAQQLSGRFPGLSEGNEVYAREQSLTGYETTLQRERAVVEVKRMRAFPLSLVVLFTYLYLSELERSDLRRIIYGILYQVPADQVNAALVVPKIPP